MKISTARYLPAALPCRPAGAKNASQYLLAALIVLSFAGCSHMREPARQSRVGTTILGSSGTWLYPESTNNWATTYGYSGCDTYTGNGMYQSPVEIIPALASSSSYSLGNISNAGYSLNLAKSPATNSFQFNLPSTGQPTLQLGNFSSGSLTAGWTITPSQIHFHIPAENLIDPTSPANAPPVPAAMEMHIVSSTAPTANFGSYPLVFAVQFKVGTPPNSQLSMTPIANALANSGSTSFNLGQFLNLFQTSGNTVYYFNGSLTTPDCGGLVIWLVLAQPQWVDSATFAAIQAAMNNGNPNNRTLQPWNNRFLNTVSPLSPQSN